MVQHCCAEPCYREHTGTYGSSWWLLDGLEPVHGAHIPMLLQGALATASSEELPFDASKVGGGERSGEHLESATVEAPRSRLIQVGEADASPCTTYTALPPGCSYYPKLPNSPTRRPCAFALPMHASRSPRGAVQHTHHHWQPAVLQASMVLQGWSANTCMAILVRCDARCASTPMHLCTPACAVGHSAAAVGGGGAVGARRRPAGPVQRRRAGCEARRQAAAAATGRGGAPGWRRPGSASW